MRKRVLLSVFIVVCLLLASATATAEDVIKIYWQGQFIETDAPPQIINGRVMVPIRAIAEASGFNVNWNPYSKTVLISKKPPSETVSEPEIIGDERFVNSTKSALNLLWQKAPNAYFFVCTYLKEIRLADVDNGNVAWVMSNEPYICYFNPNETKNMDDIERALILSHEAAHSQYDLTQLGKVLTNEDDEHIAFLFMYRVAKQLGATQYMADIANRMLQNLKP